MAYAGGLRRLYVNPGPASGPARRSSMRDCRRFPLMESAALTHTNGLISPREPKTIVRNSAAIARAACFLKPWEGVYNHAANR